MRYLVVLLVVAAILALGCGKPSVELQAPAEVSAGSLFDVTWVSADSAGIYLVLVPEGTAEGEWAGWEWHYVTEGNPIQFAAPVAAGTYEIRIATEAVEPDSTLGRVSITVVPVEASVTAPAEVAGGSSFDVSWTGPDDEGVYLVIVPAGTAEGEWADHEWHYVSEGNPIPFFAPLTAGTYEVRLATEATFPNGTFARCTVNVTGVEASVTAPATVVRETEFQVAWTGPNASGDYITIVPEGAPEGDWAEYAYTYDGNPVTLMSPADPGTYEIRYANEIPTPDVTLARTLIEVQ